MEGLKIAYGILVVVLLGFVAFELERANYGIRHIHVFFVPPEMEKFSDRLEVQ